MLPSLKGAARLFKGFMLGRLRRFELLSVARAVITG